MLKPAAKFWVAVAFAALIAALTALEGALTDNTVTAQEIVVAALAFLSAGAVYFVPNTDDGDD